MTNFEMVTRAAIMEGIYTQGQAAALMKANGGELPLYTFGEWKNRGYIVKKGQHAALKLKLWAYKGQKAAGSEDPEKDPEVKSKFYLRNMNLFDFRQVEKMAEAI